MQVEFYICNYCILRDISSETVFEAEIAAVEGHSRSSPRGLFIHSFIHLYIRLIKADKT